MINDVTCSTIDGVQVIELSRPEKKNALTQAMYRAMSDALETGDRDDAVAVHVLLGSEGVFTAGNDIADFLKHATGSGDASEITEVLRFIKLLPNIRKPLVAGVDGAAIGIGTTLLFHCDMVFATARSVFATPFLDLGLVPEAGSSRLMPERMGYARAFEMLVLGETFSAQRMNEACLLNAIVAPEKLRQHVLDVAARLAKKPAEALTISRQLMRGDATSLAQHIDLEAQAFAKRLSSPEARAAFESFLRKTSA